MSETIGRGVSRARYARRASKHAQRTLLPPRTPVVAPLVRATVAGDGQVHRFVEFCDCSLPRLDASDVCTECGVAWYRPG